MSMYPRKLGTIPEETARVARAACPKGTLAMRLRDALPVLCGLGKLRLILGVYPEQFKHRLLSLDQFKKEQNPKTTKYR